MTQVNNLLVVLLQDLENEEMNIEPLPGTQSLRTGPWRGLVDVHIRYDCVNFWIDLETHVEARCSLLPSKLEDLVRQIWMRLDPGVANAAKAWSIVERTVGV